MVYLQGAHTGGEPHAGGMCVWGGGGLGEGAGGGGDACVGGGEESLTHVAGWAAWRPTGLSCWPSGLDS